MDTFLVVLLLGSVFLAVIIKNIYFLAILTCGLSTIMIFTFIKSIIDRKTSKTRVSSKINLYCKEPIGIGIFLMYFPLLIKINYDLNFNHVLENFSKVTFKEQYTFIFIINSFIWILLLLILFIHAKIDSKKGIVYKEGLILADGKLYTFDSVKSYEFTSSYKGIKYRNLILTYNKKTVKTINIYKDDIDKFKTLLDQNKVI